MILSVGLVLVITPILNICNTWVYPVQMSALPRVLEKHQLTQGNSLFSIAYQGIDVACNAISGILIVALGAVSSYFWNCHRFLHRCVIILPIADCSLYHGIENEEGTGTYDETIEQVGSGIHGQEIGLLFKELHR